MALPALVLACLLALVWEAAGFLEPDACSALLQTGSRMSRSDSAPPEEVTILMGDNRQLFPHGIPASPVNTTWIALAAALNLQYAKLHGYRFEFVNYTGDCISPHSLKRHPSWCKLLAIQDAAQRWSGSSVVFIDSDAIFADQSVTVQSYLGSSNLTIPESSPLVNSTSSSALVKEQCRLFLPKNDNKTSSGGSRFANAGIHFWPRPVDSVLLAEWWGADIYSSKRNWEQEALNRYVIKKYPREVCSIDDNPFDLRPGQFMWHHSEVALHNRGHPLSQDFFPAVFPSLASSSFTQLMLELQDHVREMPQDALDAAAAALK